MAHFRRTSARCQRSSVSGGDEEGAPGGAWKETAESGEDLAIGGPEAGTADLALKDAELVTEGENLDAERVVRLAALDENIEEEANQGVEDSEEHGGDRDRAVGRMACHLGLGPWSSAVAARLAIAILEQDRDRRAHKPKAKGKGRTLQSVGFGNVEHMA
jgi:hypothetical protein